jgi:LPXTG-motif cell wall-anchored protein
MLTRTAVVATQLAQGTVFPTQPGGGVGGNATATSGAGGAATATKAPGTGGVGVGTPQATSTALPSTGFVDEVGLPALFGLGLALIAVVILARRLRLSANR